MQEGSQTILPGVNPHRPHVEQGMDQLNFIEEAQRAAREAEKQSTKKVKS